MATVLIATELRELVGEDPIPGHRVEWFAASDPMPKGDYAAMIPLLSRWVGGTEFKHLPNLKIVANCAIGVDNIDLVAAEFRGVIVTNTPDVLTESTADLTWALILAVVRRLKEGMDLVKAGQWKGWHPTLLLGGDLQGKTIGIVGAGRIGRAVARRAGGFGMRVLYSARNPKPDLERETGAIRADLASLLAGSEVVTLHLAATPETRGMMNRERFAQMKPGAILVNTARGEVVREPALLEALEEGRLAGAGLDVFPEEPTVHPALVTHPRVVALPHVGSATWDTRRAMADLAVRNIRAVLNGEPPLTPVYQRL